jgi:hypothetical protein
MFQSRVEKGRRNVRYKSAPLDIFCRVGREPRREREPTNRQSSEESAAANQPQFGSVCDVSVHVTLSGGAQLTECTSMQRSCTALAEP